MMHKIFWVAAVFVSIFGGGFGFLAFTAWLEVKQAPRSDTVMEYCPKHGPLMKKHLLYFMDINFGTCFLCWSEAMKNAKMNGKGGH